MDNGIHTATDVSNALTCLKNQGKTFIGRYFAVTNTWKALTANEARKISSAGLYIIYKGIASNQTLCSIKVDLDISNDAAGGWKL